MDNDIIGINNPYAKLLPETVNIDNDIIKFASPKQLHSLYKLGHVNGIILDNNRTPYAYRQFAKYNFDYLKANQEDNQSIFFDDTKYLGKIKGSGQGKRILHYKAALEVDKINMTGAQMGPDCVSWALRTALDTLRCLNIVNGKWEEWIIRQATCGLYSGRGHQGAGADPLGLSAWAIKIGTLLEQKYDTGKNKYDFTKYKDYYTWGASRGNVGMPQDLLPLTQPYAAAGYKIVKDLDTLRDVMANGCTIGCGSMLSVSDYGDFISTRTREGWNHELAIVGYDDTREFHKDCLWIFSNSWANWNRVTNLPEIYKPFPQGAFVVTEEVCRYAINDGGTTCFIPKEFFPVKNFSNSVI